MKLKNILKDLIELFLPKTESMAQIDLDTVKGPNGGNKETI